MSDWAKVRFCPSGGAPTFDDECMFQRIPNRGESIVLNAETDEAQRYVVVEIDWYDDEPLLIAHGADRPRAIEMLSGRTP